MNETDTVVRKGEDFDPKRYEVRTGKRILFVILPANTKMNYGRLSLAATDSRGWTTSCFMLGLPTESPEETAASIEFAVKSKLDYAVFPVTEPYPGTEMWSEAMRSGYFWKQRNIKTSYCALTIEFGSRMAGRARNWNGGKAFLRFYLRPRILWGWFTGLLHVSPGRSLRYIAAGLSYFLWAPMDKAREAYRGVGSRY